MHDEHNIKFVIPTEAIKKICSLDQRLYIFGGSKKLNLRNGELIANLDNIKNKLL